MIMKYDKMIEITPVSYTHLFICVMPSVISRQEKIMDGIIFTKGYRFRSGDQRKKS